MSTFKVQVMHCHCAGVQFTIQGPDVGANYIYTNRRGASKLDRNMVNHSVAALIRKCLSHKVNGNGSY